MIQTTSDQGRELDIPSNGAKRTSTVIQNAAPPAKLVAPADVRPQHQPPTSVPQRASVLARAPRRTVVLTDAIAIALGLAIPYWLSAPITSSDAYLVDRAVYLSLIGAGVVCFLAAFAAQRLYTSRFVTRASDEMRRLAVGAALGAAGLWMIAFMAKVDISRGWAIGAPFVVFALTTTSRMVLRSRFKRARSAGQLVRRVVLVGTNSESTEIGKMIAADTALGYQVVRVIEAGMDAGRPMQCDVDEIIRQVRDSGAGGVLLTASALDLASSNLLVRRLTDEGIHVELSSTLRDVAVNRLTVRSLGQFPMLYVEPTVRDGWRAIAKRTFDVTVAGALLIISLPVIAIAALAITITSPGPILFRQQRVGRDGKSFDLLKLRTMVVDAEARLSEIQHLNEADGPLFKVRSDPRVTMVGRTLRSTSIDELPQLVNVLRGQMSLVGPRPALQRELSAWSPEMHERLRVQPGITGMWQVSGRSDASFDEYRRLDLYYVDNWSLVIDLSILWRTVPAVVGRRGAH